MPGLNKESLRQSLEVLKSEHFDKLSASQLEASSRGNPSTVLGINSAELYATLLRKESTPGSSSLPTPDLRQVDGKQGTLVKIIIIESILFILFSGAIFGKEYIIRKISVISNTRTKDFIIRQEFPLNEGDNVSKDVLESAVSNCMQNLKNIGNFSQVLVQYTIVTDTNYQSSEPIPADIAITAVDKWTLFPVPYYYYDNKDGNGFVFILEESNLFGLNQWLELNAKYVSGPDLKYISVNYQYPKLFGSLYFINLNFSYQDFIDSQFDGINVTYRARTIDLINENQVGKKFPHYGTDLSVYIDSTLNLQTNTVELNTAGKQPQNITAWYIGPGIELGTINYDAGEIWGNRSRIKVGISPLNGTPQVEIINENLFKLWSRTDWGYIITAFISPGFEKPLSSSDVRGIQLGEIRGNYLIFGNSEFRPYIFKLTWPTGLYIYTPIFFDFGNGTEDGGQFSITNTIYTLGTGLRLYPESFGGNGAVIRFDIGIKLSSLLRSNPSSDYLYIGFDFKDVF